MPRASPYLAPVLAALAFAALPVNVAALEVHLVVTAHGQQLFDSWDRPTGKPFSAAPVKVANRGAFLSAVVMFTNCKPDGAGNCDAEMDLVAYDPAGKVYGEMPRAELWQRKPAPSRGYTQLSRSYMGLVIEPGDPAGVYRVVVTARDLVAGARTNAEAKFEVK